MFEEALPEAARRLGGGEYQPSSPHNLNPERPRESGDQHDWGVWFGKTGFEYYSEEAGRFASEFGLQSVRGPPNPRRGRCGRDWTTRCFNSASAARWIGSSPGLMDGT